LSIATNIRHFIIKPTKKYEKEKEREREKGLGLFYFGIFYAFYT
jgi:hypothetical protein